MSGIFLVIALLVAGIAVLLVATGERKLLNFVDYGAAQAPARINRYAALRLLLLPVAVNLACAWLAVARPQLTVPLLFLTPLSILGAVVWIAAGVARLKAVPTN